MLEDVAAYLIVAPLAASVILGALAAFLYAGSRPKATQTLARIPQRSSRPGRR